ncbi:MAG: muconolactone Delta-isomerase [Comamonas sp.]|uniref:muconolactone Delta-isomerase n=1 Tax=Comamonas sp. TaxID=34028 RepID=UPI000FA1B6E0|nr:muconolactone Delta-isomerase [uncultured Comamonas sp.]MBP7646971.1 muconolactone Delta-isomerase [Comamonas sp.]MBP9941044.1 muconolactone Delta-isomerase [Comamonas sp.]
MLFMVEMIVQIPQSLDAELVAKIKLEEKEYSQKLQREGKWRHLWRVVGEYANVSIFDADSNDALHTMLSSLPLFPYMQIKVTPLANHPSSIVQE